jgi:hypothetical protein
MARPTSESCSSIVISANSLGRGRLRFGQALEAKRLQRHDGEPFPIIFRFDTAPRDPHVELSHLTRTNDPRPTRYRIRLATSSQPFGGERWWFVCPCNGRRIGKLFLPLGGDRFYSRAAYGLGYASQRVGLLERIDRKAQKVCHVISGSTDWRDGLPPKPKWMRWPTYSRRAVALRVLIDQYDAAWVGQVGRTFPSAA